MRPVQSSQYGHAKISYKRGNHVVLFRNRLKQLKNRTWNFLPTQSSPLRGLSHPVLRLLPSSRRYFNCYSSVSTSTEVEATETNSNKPDESYSAFYQPPCHDAQPIQMAKRLAGSLLLWFVTCSLSFLSRGHSGTSQHNIWYCFEQQVTILWCVWWESSTRGKEQNKSIMVSWRVVYEWFFCLTRSCVSYKTNYLCTS